MATYTDKLSSNSTSYFNLIDNYIYIYHTQTLIILPTFPESISDNTANYYANTTILGRSAPIYSFSNAGPRTVDIKLSLHRDMMNQININSQSYIYIPNIFSLETPDDQVKKLYREDYVDLMINQLQSIALPSYAQSQKMIDPPLVAIRIGDEIFCKGIVDGGVGVQYSGPILANPLYDADGNIIYERDAQNILRKKSGKGKYAIAEISFKVTEVDPYDAHGVAQFGSFRGLTTDLERNIYKVGL